MIKIFSEKFYIEYIGSKKNSSFDVGGIYSVINIIDNYYYLVIDKKNKEFILEPHLAKIFPLLKVKIKKEFKKQNEINDDKIYDVISIETGFKENDTYRIIDESEEDYIYPKKLFEIIEDNTYRIKEKTRSKKPNVT